MIKTPQDECAAAITKQIMRTPLKDLFNMVKAFSRRSDPVGIAIAFLVLLMTAMIMTSTNVAAQPHATQFTLKNGMQVVVIPDHRAPVVTHMVWYRVGAADEQPGKSGIAHFLEHLMFKSTDRIPMGEFSKIIARLGGQDNAFTSQDVTAYHQRISKDHLQDMMAMEADRMVNLRLTEKEVLTERNVILEERRTRIDNNPSSILSEQMDAALYLNHPYGIPVIGWEHEMEHLTRKDALTFYKHYYAPNNAVLVVAGDVTPDEVLKMAQATYGKLPANQEVGKARSRPQEPPHKATTHIELKDPRVGKATLTRTYLTASYNSDKNDEAEAEEVMVKILAEGSTGRLYKKLVVDEKIASSTGGWYSGTGKDSGTLSLYAIAADGTDLKKIEAAIDREIARVQQEGVSEAELERAKNSLIADYVYQSDSQAALARNYGFAIAVGRTIEDIESWPDRIRKVTAKDIKTIANKVLDPNMSVTGYLIPAPAGNDNQSTKNTPLPAHVEPRG